MRLSQRGAVLLNHEITAINTIMGEQGYYKQSIREIMSKASRLEYKAPDGTVYVGFKNIIRAQRRGLIPSDILDTGKFANIFNDLRSAYSDAKRIAEKSLPDDILAGIRDREFEKKMNTKNQKYGNINQVLEDSNLQKTLNIAK